MMLFAYKSFFSFALSIFMIPFVNLSREVFAGFYLQYISPLTFFIPYNLPLYLYIRFRGVKVTLFLKEIYFRCISRKMCIYRQKSLEFFLFFVLFTLVQLLFESKIMLYL